MSADEIDSMAPFAQTSSSSGNMLDARSLKSSQRSWAIKPSPLASGTINPIRQVVERMNVQPNPDKPLIPLSIGDPTIFGNLTPSQETIESLIESVKTGKNHGYFSSVGTEEARKAVAQYSSIYGLEIEAKDVILTSGASHALDMCIGTLASPGQNILVPRPGFPLYQTLSSLYRVETKFYDLKPDSNWEVDLEDLEAQIDEKTAAIVYNNPSNPCGSVFSKEHIEAILQIAERNQLPIIADEIYEDVVFSNYEFYPIASLSTEVPILSVGGLTKKFLIPGWRMGWLIIHDRKNRFGQETRQSLVNLSQRLVGPNSIVQGAIPAILSRNKQSFYDNTISLLQRNAELCYEKLKRVPGLFPIMPQGAMYIMVRIDMEAFPAFDSDLKFVEQLVNEESVFCLPGKCFDLDGYMRIVLSVPETLMAEAMQRIGTFCVTHYTFNNPPTSLTEEQRRLLGHDSQLNMLNLTDDSDSQQQEGSTNGHNNEHNGSAHYSESITHLETTAIHTKGGGGGCDATNSDRGPDSLVGTPESKTL